MPKVGKKAIIVINYCDSKKTVVLKIYVVSQLRFLEANKLLGDFFHFLLIVLCRLYISFWLKWNWEVGKSFDWIIGDKIVFYLNSWDLISWESGGKREITRPQISQAIFCLSLSLSGGPSGTLGSLLSWSFISHVCTCSAASRRGHNCSRTSLRRTT